MSKLQLKYNPFFLLVLLLISSYSLHAERIQYEINYPELMRSDKDVLTYLSLTKQQAKNVKTIVITLYSYYNALPVSAKDFPNLRKLVIKESFKIHDLKGLVDFKKLESLEIDCSFANEIHAEETNPLFYNFSEIWKLKNLKELYINAPVFDISDSILNLKKLEKLTLITYQFPAETILKMNQLKKIKYYPFYGNYNTEILADGYMLLHHKLGENVNEILKQYYFSRNGFNEINKKDVTKLQFFDRDMILEFYKINLFDKENKPDNTGKYQLYYKNGKIAVDGWYKNGQRDSLWNYYDTTGIEKAYQIYKLGKLVENYITDKSIYQREAWDYLNKNNEIVYEEVQFLGGYKEKTIRKNIKDTVIIQNSYNKDKSIDSVAEKHLFYNFKGAKFLIYQNYSIRKDSTYMNSMLYSDKPEEKRQLDTLIYSYDENEDKAYLKATTNSSDTYCYYDLSKGKSYSIETYKNNKSSLKIKFMTTVQSGEYSFYCRDLQYDTQPATIECNCSVEKIKPAEEHIEYRVFANNLCEECKAYYDNREKNLEFFQKKFNKYDDYIKTLK